MAGKAPLLLAAFLFGIGASGLILLTLADRAEWGPFRPQLPPQPPQRVIVIDVGRPYEPPPLHDLFTAGAAVEALRAEATAEPAPPAETPAPPTPIPPLRIHGIAAEGSASAAGATPTPPQPLRIINVAADEGDPSEDD